MARLPDLEGLAIFAKVAECRSFANAAAEMHLSKATVSKAIQRIEAKLGVLLIVRTARSFDLTEEGRQLLGRAAHILAEGEAAEDSTQARARAPRGLVRLAVPMSLGISHIAPLLPDFLASFPEISVDLHLSDAITDVIGDGFDAAIRIAVQPGPSLVVQLLREMPRFVIGSPDYLRRFGRPSHPMHLAAHRCIGYGTTANSEIWRFTKGRKSASVRPTGPLRVNNGDAMMPALVAGTGLGVLPEFLLQETLASGQLERVLPDWSLPLGGIYWVTPEGLMPRRIEVLRDFLVERLS
jgi:DNA-binding transcriptional LysR family regulator